MRSIARLKSKFCPCEDCLSIIVIYNSEINISRIESLALNIVRSIRKGNTDYGLSIIGWDCSSFTCCE